MKKRILFLLLALVLVLSACGTAGGQTEPSQPTGSTGPAPTGSVSTDPTEPEWDGIIRFRYGGTDAWLEFTEEGNVTFAMVADEEILAEAELLDMGITGEKEAVLQSLVRYSGANTVAEDVRSLTIEKVEVGMNLVCNDPEKTVPQLLAAVQQQNPSIYELYESMLEGGYVDAEEAGMSYLASIIGQVVTFRIVDNRLENMKVYKGDVLYSEMTFHANGNTKTTTGYNEDGSISRLAECYETGVEKTVTRYTDGIVSSVAECNEYGDTVRWTSYNPDGSVADGTYSVYEYGDNGNRTYYADYGLDDVLRRQEDYYEDGSTKTSLQYHSNGQIYSQYEYDENGEVVLSVWYEEDGTVSSYQRYEREYHDNGNLKSKSEYNEYGECTLEIHYDENGNEINRIEHGN